MFKGELPSIGEGIAKTSEDSHGVRDGSVLKKEGREWLDKQRDWIENGEQPAAPKYKPEAAQKQNDERVAALYQHLNDARTPYSEAGETYDAIDGILTDEQNQIEGFLRGNGQDKALEAFAHTRSLEIEKMKLELEKHKIEKRMWELHVESSPDKTKLQEELDNLNRDRSAIIGQIASALQEEQDILVSQSPRLSYINEQLVGSKNVPKEPSM